jgi:hypothetical protein
MSLKLWLASAWTPEGTRFRILDRVAVSTLSALDALLGMHAPGSVAGLKSTAGAPGGSLERRRVAMASAQNERVKALVEAVGRDEAVRLGRDALFMIGMALGGQARRELSVGRSPGDLERAARVLYRALGIHFALEAGKDGTMLLRVDRCALSHHYSEDACLVLGAADEGMVAGLNPRYAMRFEQRMTGGRTGCLARIREEGK